MSVDMKTPVLPVHSKDVTDGASKGLLSIGGLTSLFLWYTFSGTTLFLNKYILSYLNCDPTILGVCQLVCTTVLGFIQLNILSCFKKHSSRVKRTRRFYLNILIVGVLRCGTTVLSLISLKFVAVSFTETVKSSAPIFTVFIAWCMLGEVTGFWVKLSLLPVMAGLALCSSNELSFNLLGFGAALSTNMVECCQNVFSKKLISEQKYSPTELQFYTSLSSVLVQTPLTYLSVGAAQLDSLSPELVTALVTNGVSFHMQSFTAYLLMDYISPVTYSVANTAKRALLITVSVLLFHNAVTPLSALGTATVLFGVLCYNSAQRAESARRRAAQGREEAVTGVQVER